MFNKKKCPELVACQTCNCAILKGLAVRKEELSRKHISSEDHWGFYTEEQWKDIYYCVIHAPSWDYIDKTREVWKYLIRVPATTREVGSMGETLMPTPEEKSVNNKAHDRKNKQ